MHRFVVLVLGAGLVVPPQGPEVPPREWVEPGRITLNPA